MHFESCLWCSRGAPAAMARRPPRRHSLGACDRKAASHSFVRDERCSSADVSRTRVTRRRGATTLTAAAAVGAPALSVAPGAAAAAAVGEAGQPGDGSRSTNDCALLSHPEYRPRPTAPFPPVALCLTRACRAAALPTLQGTQVAAQGHIKWAWPARARAKSSSSVSSCYAPAAPAPATSAAAARHRSPAPPPPIMNSCPAQPQTWLPPLHPPSVTAPACDPRPRPRLPPVCCRHACLWRLLPGLPLDFQGRVQLGETDSQRLRLATQAVVSARSGRRLSPSPMAAALRVWWRPPRCGWADAVAVAPHQTLLPACIEAATALRQCRTFNACRDGLAGLPFHPFQRPAAPHPVAAVSVGCQGRSLPRHPPPFSTPKHAALHPK